MFGFTKEEVDEKCELHKFAMFVEHRRVDDHDAVVVWKRTTENTCLELDQARKWNKTWASGTVVTDDIHGQGDRVPHWKAEVRWNVGLANCTRTLASNACKGLVCLRKCDWSASGHVVAEEASESFASNERGGSTSVDKTPGT